MMGTYGKLIVDFVEAWNRLDYDTIEAAMTPDIHYHNIPMEPCIGIEAFRQFMRDLPPSKADWTIHHIAENGPVVLTERTDRFEIGGQWIAIRVMGIFEFDGDKIAKWRDYFDLAEFRAQLSGRQACAAD